MINDNNKVIHGLTQIRGVGLRFAQAIVESAGINPEKRIGDLSDKELQLIEDIILNPIEYSIPYNIANRKNDPSEVLDKHLSGNQLVITTRRDIERIMKIKSYKSRVHGLHKKLSGLMRGRALLFNKKKLKDLVENIHSLMKTRKTNEILMECTYLPEFIDEKFLEFKQGYKLKYDIQKALEKNAIETRYLENFIIFTFIVY